ncbi:hypothetical protein VNI00_003625 [Paramarasmius palmivorus]|uniref:Uncharacterized protein n=1 Tax=Paramarasmius palmivorus TaxID=297713 RepID=A0AAW0DP04_9AGAR
MARTGSLHSQTLAVLTVTLESRSTSSTPIQIDNDSEAEVENCLIPDPDTDTDTPPSQALKTYFHSTSPYTPTVVYTLPLKTGTRIPKPPGAAGRRKGGYSLEWALTSGRYKWSKTGYAMIQQRTKELVSEHFDMAKTYRDQDVSRKDRVCELIVRDYPFLADYIDNWPIRDMMKAFLKYRRTAAKLEKLREAAGNRSRDLRLES